MDTYDTALGESLELKPGADKALRAAKRGGRSVMVISEGPHDAQQTTIERLGIAPMVDLLVTSGSEGTSKSHDLFGRALARAGCDPTEIVFVGDSLERDVGPASALGITCFYVGEERLPEGSAAVKLGLTALSELIERIAPPYDESVRYASTTRQSRLKALSISNLDDSIPTQTLFHIVGRTYEVKCDAFRFLSQLEATGADHEVRITLNQLAVIVRAERFAHGHCTACGDRPESVGQVASSVAPAISPAPATTYSSVRIRITARPLRSSRFSMLASTSKPCPA